MSFASVEIDEGMDLQLCALHTFVHACACSELGRVPTYHIRARLRAAATVESLTWGLLQQMTEASQARRPPNLFHFPSGP